MVVFQFENLGKFSPKHFLRTPNLFTIFSNISKFRKFPSSLPCLSSLHGWWIQHVRYWMIFYQMFGSIQITPRWGFFGWMMMDELICFVKWREDVDVDVFFGWEKGVVLVWLILWFGDFFLCAAVVWSFFFACGNGGSPIHSAPVWEIEGHQSFQANCAVNIARFLLNQSLLPQGEACGNSPGYGELGVDGGGGGWAVGVASLICK